MLALAKRPDSGRTSESSDGRLRRPALQDHQDLVDTPEGKDLVVTTESMGLLDLQAFQALQAPQDRRPQQPTWTPSRQLHLKATRLEAAPPASDSFRHKWDQWVRVVPRAHLVLQELSDLLVPVVTLEIRVR